MSRAIFRSVSAESTLSGYSSLSEAVSSPISTPRSSPVIDSDPNRIDSESVNTSIIFPFDSLPYLSLDATSVASSVGKWLTRIRSFCEACYFLRQLRPIRVIEMLPNGRQWEWDDYHQGDAERCPWRLLRPGTPYDDFRRQVCSMIRLRHPLESEWTICVVCDGFYACRAGHEHAGHGPSLFMVAFFVWEHAAIRDCVLSFLHAHTLIPIPDLHSRTDYAFWLGSSACAPWSGLLHLHVLVTTYHTLRNSGLLPLYVAPFHILSYPHQSHRPSQPDVDDVVNYRTAVLS